MPNPLTGIDWEEVRKEYEDTPCVRDIAARFGVKECTLRQRIKRGAWGRPIHPAKAAQLVSQTALRAVTRRVSKETAKRVSEGIGDTMTRAVQRLVCGFR